MALEKDELNNTWKPKCDLCDWEGEPDAEQGKAQAQYLSHCKTQEHKENKKNKQEEKAAAEPEVQNPPGEDKTEKVEPPKVAAPEPKAERKPTMEELSETEILTMHGEEGKRFLKRKKLEQLLGMAPDMSEKITRWVMENYDQDENAKRDLNALYMLLMNCKVKQEYAGRIVQMIMAMETKWWNEQNNQANNGMYFPTGPDGRGGGPSGFQVFYDQWGRPINQNFNQPWLNNPDSRGGYDPRYDPRYDQRYDPRTSVNPQIEDIKKTVADMAKTVSMLVNPPKPEQQPVSKEDIVELVVTAVKKATEEPPLTKQDIVETVVQTVKTLSEKNEEETHLDLIVKELKGMRGDIDRLDRGRTPMPEKISEEGSIEVKKLDIIGDKLGDIHETVKHGMSLLLTGDEKPRQRTGEDITTLDAELDRMAGTPGGS